MITIKATARTVNHELIGFLSAGTALGFVLYFSIDVNQAGAFGLRSEIERLADGKPWNFIAYLIAGIAAGSLCGFYERAKSKTLRAVDDSFSLTTRNKVIIAVEIIIIIAALALMLYQVAVMTLIFWIIAMLSALVVPTVMRVRAPHDTDSVVIRRTDSE